MSISASQALRMVIKLEVDQSLKKNYAKYQTHSNTCIFPTELHQFPWNDVQQITEYINKQTQIPIEHQRLFFRGREITLKRSKKNKLSSPTLSSLRITHESILYLQCEIASVDLLHIVSYGYYVRDPLNRTLIHDCIHGLNNDLKPILSNDGEGGTYFLRNAANVKIACFKPSDEEAGCPNNPRGRIDPKQGMHCGIKPGEGNLREIAAYLLDSDGFHCVPATLRVECAYKGFHYNKGNSHRTKIGALQKFVNGEVIENFGVKNFAIREVHKIGILDIRILNCDRNSGNVLVSRDSGRYELIPIDHGLSLPEKIEITRDSWVWLNWYQSKQPFDPYTIEYINNIDINADIACLKGQLNFTQIVFDNMRISHLVLVKCANMGMTLNQIGSIIARPDYDRKSILEELMSQAEILATEKVRQNKHLVNRVKFRKRYKSESESSNSNNNKHILHKFIEKGIAMKNPLLNPLFQRENGSQMQFIASLAPPNARLNHSNRIQVLNKSPQSAVGRDHSNVSRSGLNILSLSPTPSILTNSTSLGANGPMNGMHRMSRTPEPKPLIIVEKKRSLNDRKDISHIHWTPTYRATSLLSHQSSNPSTIRSVTPDKNTHTHTQTQSHSQTQTPQKRSVSSGMSLLFLENKNKKTVDPELDNETEFEVLHSPLEIISMEKTLSIHDRTEANANESNTANHSMQMNDSSIFRTISNESSIKTIDEIVSEKAIASVLLDTIDTGVSSEDSKKGNQSKATSFSALNIDLLVRDSEQKQSSNNAKTDMVPLSRSQSCLHTIISSQNRKKNGVRLNKDEDSFLYSSLTKGQLKSTSLINHQSMLDMRERVNVNSDDSNGMLHSMYEYVTESGMNGNGMNGFGEEFNHRSYSEQTMVTNCKTTMNGHDSPSTRTPSTPSNKSQDDMVRNQTVEFGIHPIMERMQKENYQTKKWFWYYLDQLLGIQCERISNNARKVDICDDIYDVDTVHGSFIWKNELRKHWIRSRLERKRLMQPLPPTNPFESQISFANSKTTVLRNCDDSKVETKAENKTVKYSQNPFDAPQLIERDCGNYIDLEHLEEDEEDANNGWFGAETNLEYDSDDYNDYTEYYEDNEENQ